MAPVNSSENKYRISVVIPNRNGAETIGLCLEALFASSHNSFEVVVVDDCSGDNSVAIIKQFPCKLVELTSHVGAAAARTATWFADNGATVEEIPPMMSRAHLEGLDAFFRARSSAHLL